MNGEIVTIGITLAALWGQYSDNAQSGRFACPVRVRNRGDATHIYRGFGAIRLERNPGPITPGKGFRGEEIAAAPVTRAGSVRLQIED